jgi:hypothetical protein
LVRDLDGHLGVLLAIIGLKSSKKEAKMARTLNH